MSIPSLPRKPSSSTSSSLGIGSSMELGSFGGVRITGNASVDLKSLAPIAGGLDIDPINESIGLGGKVDISTPAGDFGVSGGVSISTKDGKVSIKDVSGGIRAFGLGGSVSVDKEGRASVTIDYEYGAGRVGITFAPDGEKEEEKQSEPEPEPKPPEPEPNNPTAPKPPQMLSPPNYPVGKLSFCKLVVEVKRKSFEWTGDYTAPGNSWAYQFGNNNETRSEVDGQYDKFGVLTGHVTYYKLSHHFHTYPASYDSSHPEKFSENANTK